MAEKKLTEDEVLDLYIQTVDNPLSYNVTNEDTIEMFKALSRVDGFDEYLRACMGDDIKLYFAASDEKQRDQVRGAYRRAIYFRSMLRKVRQMGELDTSRAKKTKVVAH